MYYDDKDRPVCSSTEGLVFLKNGLTFQEQMEMNALLHCFRRAINLILMLVSSQTLF